MNVGVGLLHVPFSPILKLTKRFVVQIVLVSSQNFNLFNRMGLFTCSLLTHFEITKAVCYSNHFYFFLLALKSEAFERFVKNKKRLRLLCYLSAERAGFEPAVQLPVRQFSKLFLSATQAPLLYRIFCGLQM